MAGRLLGFGMVLGAATTVGVGMEYSAVSLAVGLGVVLGLTTGALLGLVLEHSSQLRSNFFTIEPSRN